MQYTITPTQTMYLIDGYEIEPGEIQVSFYPIVAMRVRELEDGYGDTETHFVYLEGTSVRSSTLSALQKMYDSDDRAHSLKVLVGELNEEAETTSAERAVALNRQYRDHAARRAEKLATLVKAKP